LIIKNKARLSFSIHDVQQTHKKINFAPPKEKGPVAQLDTCLAGMQGAPDHGSKVPAEDL